MKTSSLISVPLCSFEAYDSLPTAGLDTYVSQGTGTIVSSTYQKQNLWVHAAAVHW